MICGYIMRVPIFLKEVFETTAVRAKILADRGLTTWFNTTRNLAALVHTASY